jgi:hypothetical protein
MTNVQISGENESEAWSKYFLKSNELLLHKKGLFSLLVFQWTFQDFGLST